MFEVYALRSSRGKVALRAQIGLVGEQSARTWIHCASVGSWKGHAAGEFVMTPDTFRAVVANFERQANAIPLTYEHPQYAGDGQPIPCAGWVHKFDIRSGGTQLWALVEFTPRAAAFVKNGEYRFCSIVLDLEATDRVTGKPAGPEIFEIGLTNTPFIDGLAPIRLSRRAPGKVRKMAKQAGELELIQEAIKALGDKVTVEAIGQWVEGRKAQLAAEEGKPAEADAEEPGDMPADMADVPAPQLAAVPEPETVEASDAPADAVEAADAPSADAAPANSPDAEAALGAIESIAGALGMDVPGAIAAIQENADAIAQIIGGQSADGTAADSAAGVFAQSSVKALEEQVRKLTEERDAYRNKEVAAKIDGAIAAGRFLEADREKLVKLSQKAPELLDEWIERGSSPVPPQGRVTASANPKARGAESFTEDGLSDVERVHFDAALAALRVLKAPDAREQAFAIARRKVSEIRN